MVEGACLRADFAMRINPGLVRSVRKVSIIRTVTKLGLLSFLQRSHSFSGEFFEFSRNLLRRCPPPRIMVGLGENG